MVLSAVRCNQKGSVGFLDNIRRMNVALTRAQHGLIIVGNAQTLKNDKNFATLVAYFKELNCFVNGIEEAKALIIERQRGKNEVSSLEEDDFM